MAATIVWDGNAADGLFTNVSNWGGTAPTDDLLADIAQLTGGTVDLDIDRQVNGLYFSDATILSGAGSIEVGSGGIEVGADSTIETVFTGAGALSISGGNTLTVTADSTGSFTGDISIDGSGTVLKVIRHSIALDDEGSANITLSNGGELSAGAGSGTSRHLDLTGRNIIVDSTGGILRHAHNYNVYGMAGTVISGDGELTLAGGTSDAGRIQLQGVNTYTGGTRIIDGAQVYVYNSSSLGTGLVTFDGGDYMAASSVTLTNMIVIDAGGAEFKGSGKSTVLSGNISGSGALTVSSGTVTLTADSTATYTGDISIGAGAVLKASQHSIALDSESANIILDGGELAANGNNHMNLANRQIILTENGGTVRHGSSKNIYGSTKITGAGQLIIAGENGDDGRFQMTGVGSDYTGGTLIIEGGQAWAYYDDSFGTGSVTLDGGDFRAVNNATFANDFIIESGGGDFKVAGKNVSFTGVLSGSGTAVIKDGGTISFDNIGNTFSGVLDLGTSTASVSLSSLGNGATIIGGGDGTSLTFTGDILVMGANTFAGTNLVGSTGAIGGSGSLAGALTLDAGAGFVFSETDSLTVAGLVTLDDSFSIEDLIGLTSTTADGTYTLIETVSTFDYIQNFGIENAFDLGDGKSAYFGNGSLQVTVIPEPATLGLIATFGGGILFIRRRLMF
ncbi:MAG: hypothetical protein V5783_11560 [Pontiella sp.]